MIKKIMKCGNPKCTYIAHVRTGKGLGIWKKMDYHHRTRCGKGKYAKEIHGEEAIEKRKKKQRKYRGE